MVALLVVLVATPELVKLAGGAPSEQAVPVGAGRSPGGAKGEQLRQGAFLLPGITAPLDAQVALPQLAPVMPPVAELPVPALPEPPPTDSPVVAPPSFEPPARTPAPRPRRARAGAGREGGVWAVVVGIDDYPGPDHDLKAAVADAREVDATLEAFGVPASRRVLLLDGEASAKAIRGALGWLADRAAADATAVFFYAGHVRQVTRGADGDAEEVDEAIVAADGGEVLDGDMARDLRRLEARSVWLAVAGCYGAGFDDALAPGRVLSAAASEHDLAYENSGLGRSYLVHYMVRQALREGQAAGSVQEAFAWARDRIAQDYPGRIPVLVDRAAVPVSIRQPGTPAPPSPGRTGPAPATPAPAPSPEQPPAPPPEQQPPSCTSLVGVKLCSTDNGGDSSEGDWNWGDWNGGSERTPPGRARGT